MTHQSISFSKSALRIAGYVAVAVAPFIIPIWNIIWVCGWGLLVVSEGLGIVEEIGEK